VWRRCDTLDVRGLVSPRRVRKTAPVTWESYVPGGDRVLSSVYFGIPKFRVYNPSGSLEPPWLKFFNHANGDICVRTSKEVRRFLTSLLGRSVPCGRYVWLSHDHGESLASFLETNVRPRHCGWYPGKTPGMCPRVRTYFPDIKPVEPRTIRDSRGENLYKGKGKTLRQRALTNLHVLLDESRSRRLDKVPSWYPKLFGIPSSIIRNSSRKLDFRERVVQYLLRIHYYKYVVDRGKRSISHVERMSASDMSSHLLWQAFSEPIWFRTASLLFGRLKVLLRPPLGRALDFVW